jgi:hypothetical protein
MCIYSNIDLFTQFSVHKSIKYALINLLLVILYYMFRPLAIIRYKYKYNNKITSACQKLNHVIIGVKYI